MVRHRQGNGNVRRWGKTDSVLIKSMLASILLHALILALLYQHIWLPIDDGSLPVSLPDTEIKLVRTNPQRHSVQPVQEFDEPLPAPAADSPPDAPTTDSIPDIAPPVDTEAGSNAEKTANEIVEPSEGAAESESITTATLNDAINSFTSSYRGDLNNQWLENCVRRRNESVARDCDDDDTAEYRAASEERENIRQLFTDMHPDLYYSLYKRRFELANAALQPLTERDDLVGALARNRHDLNEANLRYLNHQFTGDNPDMMTMRICIPMPCVFRFSEFEVKKPEVWEEASENQSRFQVTAPLFQAQ